MKTTSLTEKADAKGGAAAAAKAEKRSIIRKSSAKAEKRSIIRWIVLGFAIAMAVAMWVRRARKVEELARSREREALDRAEKLERQLRDLSMKVSEMSRSRI